MKKEGGSAAGHTEERTAHALQHVGYTDGGGNGVDIAFSYNSPFVVVHSFARGDLFLGKTRLNADYLA